MEDSKRKEALKTLKDGWSKFLEEIKTRGEAIIDSGDIPPTPIHLIEVIINSMIEEVSVDSPESLASEEDCSTDRIIN